MSHVQVGWLNTFSSLKTTRVPSLSSLQGLFMFCCLSAWIIEVHGHLSMQMYGWAAFPLTLR